MFDDKVGLYKNGLNEFVWEYIGFDKKILDIGCCEGKLGGYLRKKKGAVVFGVDISQKAIRRARRNLDKVYCLNIESDRLPFSQKAFDVIICADILEHLQNPLLVLKKLRLYLKKSGILVLSVPNVANIKIRWSLLLGKFDYQKEGIMDDSHLHFFTKKTIFQLIEQAGMKIEAVSYSPGFSFFFFQGRELKSPFLKRIHQLLINLAPTLLCRQFVVVACL